MSTKTETKTEIVDAPLVTKSAFKFKTVKNVTLPLIKPTIGQEFYIGIINAMYVGKDIQQVVGGKKMEPATLVDCTDLETGELCQFIVPAVLKSIFDDEYTDNAYVGKQFALTKLAKKADKGYFGFKVSEIEI
tara:strand:+ start:9092 stop:9490 length:399 start_codon:yes stop_codon:yes gene_type:complete